MNEPQEMNPVLRLGTLSLSGGRPAAGKPHVWTLVFKNRKNGFDYLGQATLCARLPEMRVEMFNDGYYAHFSQSPEEVRASLVNKLLALLAGGSALPEPWRQAALSLRQGGKPADLPPAPREGEPDLEEIYARLNAEYFQGRVSARVMWGRDSGGHNRSGFRFGSYDGEKKLIRVHPRLKQEFVPLAVVELTVYHEMCHQWVPAIRKNGAWRPHHPGFRKKEREYRRFEEARLWERRHWRKLLRPVAKK